MRVTAGAFAAKGLPVPDDPRRLNAYQLSERQGWPWTPWIDTHTGRRGAELLGGTDFLCIDADTQMAIDGSVWLDGLRWLTDHGALVGRLLDISEFVAVRTPGDPGRQHAAGWHLWCRADPDYPVRIGPLERCKAVEIKNRATSPGSPAYEVRYAPAELPVIPRWIAELAGPPRVPVAAERRNGGGVPAWRRLEGVIDRLLEAGPGDHRNDLLYWSACRAGEMIAAGDFDAATAERLLFSAAEQNGHVAKHGAAATLATIGSGLQAVAA